MTDKGIPEDILNVNKAWLPPSPHVDRVVEMVQRGRAHIERRGHDLAPLVVFEDGGVIELPNVRYDETHRGVEIISAANAAESEHTRHPDVCGCVDELRGLFDDGPSLIGKEPDRFRRLITDALYMEARMRERIYAYNRFFADVAEVCAAEVDVPNADKAFIAAEELRRMIDDAASGGLPDIDDLFHLVEGVRDVASRQEAALAEMRNMAVRIGALYAEIKGARNW